MTEIEEEDFYYTEDVKFKEYPITPDLVAHIRPKNRTPGWAKSKKVAKRLKHGAQDPLLNRLTAKKLFV